MRGEVEFYPSALERGVRSERALKCAIAEMYVKGVSTRKVTAGNERAVRAGSVQHAGQPGYPAAR